MSNQHSELDESYEFSGGSSSFEASPFDDRILGREAFYLGGERGAKSEDLKKDGEARCFVLRRPGRNNIYGGVEIRLKAGLRDDGSFYGRPYWSAARLNEGWTYKNKKGKTVIGLNGAPKNCPLGRLVRTRQDLIAQATFKGQPQFWPARDGEEPQPKLDYKKIFAVEVLEVLFEYADAPDPANPGKTRRVVVKDQATGKPKYTINPRPFIWVLNEPWWDQLRMKVLFPQAAEAMQQAADIDAPAQAAPKKLPTSDPSKVVLKLFAKTDEKEPTRAAYTVDFSPSLVIDASAVQIVDPLPEVEGGGAIDWDQVFPPMTAEQAAEVISEADSGWGGVPAATPAGPPKEGPKADGPPPATDDDIPF